jgi:hypothetical protein
MAVEFITHACKYLLVTIRSSGKAASSCFDQLVASSQNTPPVDYHELNSDQDSDENESPLETNNLYKESIQRSDGADRHFCGRDSLSPSPEIFSGRIEDLYGTGGKINAQIKFYPTPRHEPIPEYSKPLLSEYGSA